NQGGGALLLTRTTGGDFTVTASLQPDGQISTASTDAWTVTIPTVSSGDSFSLSVDSLAYTSSATSAAVVATAFATALAGDTNLVATSSGPVLTIIALVSGIATPTLSKNGTA